MLQFCKNRKRVADTLHDDPCTVMWLFL